MTCTLRNEQSFVSEVADAVLKEMFFSTRCAVNGLNMLLHHTGRKKRKRKRKRGPMGRLYWYGILAVPFRDI